MLVEVGELVGGAEDCTVNGLSDERTENARSEEDRLSPVRRVYGVRHVEDVVAIRFW